MGCSAGLQDHCVEGWPRLYLRGGGEEDGESNEDLLR